MDLLCSARDDIKLADRVCDPANWSAYLDYWRGACAAGRVRTVTNGSTLLGMVVLHPHHGSMMEILYVVVAKVAQGQGIGPLLIRHVQSLDGVAAFRAEARNDRSRRMLERCGFAMTGEANGEYPILVWQRGA